MTGYDGLEAETVVPQGTTITLQMYPKAEVDALIAKKDEEIHRLGRALYKACANWAHAEYRWSSSTDWGDQQGLAKMERKCLKKVEEYK